MKKSLILLILLIPFIFFGQLNGSNKYSYLAIGDSYTIGEGVKKSKRWPVLLSKALRKKLKKPVIIAKTGWTSNELIDTLNIINFKNNFDFVSLLIGVNNQYRGMDIENFRKDFVKLLEMSMRYTMKKHKRVFVLSIPDWGTTPYSKNKDSNKISKEINIFNDVIIEECKRKNITYIDITQNSRKALYDNTLVAKDSLHPSKKMYKQWAEIIEPYFKNYL